MNNQQTPYNKYIVVLSLSLAGFFVLSISIMLKGVITNILEQVDNTFYAQFLSVRERLKEDIKPIDSGVIIVGIDDRSLNKLGAYSPMQYRKYHIDALANILKGKPAAVVYDILFGDPHDDPAVDFRLAETMKQGPVFSVVFGAAQDRSDGAFASYSRKMPSNVKNKSFISENGFEYMTPPVLSGLTSVGLANAYPDNDGIIRKMPIFFRVDDSLYPTIALEVFRNITGIEREDIRIQRGKILVGGTSIPVDKYCRAYVNMDRDYRIREIPFYDIYKGRVPAEFFKDKVIFVAATATGLGDNKLVPLYGYISGVLIHANLFLNLKNNNFIHEITGNRYRFIIFLVSLIYTYIYYSRSDLSTLSKIMGYITNVSLAMKFGTMVSKMQLVNRMVHSFKTAREKHYGLRFFFLLFAEARKRIEPLLLHLILLYLAIFLTFYFFHIFIKPAALIIQLFIAYIIVSEFKQIDFTQIATESSMDGELTN